SRSHRCRGSGLRFDSSRRLIRRLPSRVAELEDRNGRSFHRRDEFAVADVYARMQFLLVVRQRIYVVEHEVSGLEFLPLDLNTGSLPARRVAGEVRIVG